VEEVQGVKDETAAPLSPPGGRGQGQGGEAAISELLRRTMEWIGERRRLPLATYRLQFHAGFTFRDAARIAPYLSALGISHAYASPYLKACAGSLHGYDIIDHHQLNPEIGKEKDYAGWIASLSEHGLGQILDIVPNHMGVATNDNAWWNDVLENGPASVYSGFFDIAWRASPRPELQDKVLLPVLGEPYGDELEKGELRLAFDSGAFAICYHDRRFPVAGRTYAAVLAHRLDQLDQLLPADAPGLAEYHSILTAVKNLPDRSETHPARVVERQREKEVIKRRLAAMVAEDARVRDFIDQNVAQFNGRSGDPRSFDLLDDLLEHQCYRLAYWRVAPDEINYRRFFDINDLAALNMEREEVFEAAHGLVLELAADGKVHGLRVDHPDGLYDPARYFLQLQEHYVLACAHKVFDGDSGFQGLDWGQVREALRKRQPIDWSPEAGHAQWPLYVVAEKILGPEETIPEDWAVYGTTGYDYLNQVNGLFIDLGNAKAFSHLYAEFVQDDLRWTELVYRKKLQILNVSLASELHMLAHQLDRLAQKSRRSRDFTFNMLRLGLREIIAAFPVYRSYVAADGAHAADRRYIDTAVRRATARNPLLSRRLFRAIRDILLLNFPESFSEEDRAEARRFAAKFQQVTAPVAAKGVEDTVFYVYNRLLSLNEVGGEPDRFGAGPESLHNYFTARQAKCPFSLSPLSTHDTKRSEDVRARLNVLSEIPDAWSRAIQRWSQLNAPHRQSVEDQTAPDANEEYLLYQTLLGAWPLEPHSAAEYESFVSRISAYMEKALHEAKVHTSWINPNTDYDGAVRAFVERILDATVNREFLDDFSDFQRRISHYGLYYSLAQTLLKLTAPGVPDTYQGTELWDFSLVDPDNRRPVDYEHRMRILEELQSGPAAKDVRAFVRGLVDAKEDGRIKMYVTYCVLQFRRQHSSLFSEGTYTPLRCAGEHADHVFAFARSMADSSAIIVVPRLLTGLVSDPTLHWGEVPWQETKMLLGDVSSAGGWRNVFTGETILASGSEGQPALTAADVFGHFPVALLVA
jgi:(1->4)-alpha-D-glucan 1-alpha-D-glucosylmutase